MRASKKTQIIEKSLEIFYRDGFHATGMDTLVAQTGISKTTIYKYFPTKQDLIMATLAHRDAVFLQWMGTRIDELASDPQDRVLAFFDVLAQWFQSPDFRGCMFIKASGEFQEAAHPIHKQSAEHKQLVLDLIEGYVGAAGIANPEQTARSLMLLAEGAIVTAHLGHTQNPANDAKRAAQKLIQVT